MGRAALALIVVGCALAASALGGCGRRSGLYADRAVPIAPTAKSADGQPRFIGRWAASASQCADPLVLQAHSLKTGAVDCSFDKVESSSAGYAMSALCRSAGALKPARLVIVAPNQAKISILTISGGPFHDPAAMQRCLSP